MIINTIDAKTLKKMFLAGAKSIEAKKEYINELNVFPVPDGDTGTNMTMTIMAAAKEVSQLEDLTMENLAKAISGGSLRGARGNSGVILSQLFRGFTKEIAQSEVLDIPVITKALQRAVETAYKAVMKPKEGTILTVARGGAIKAAELVGKTTDIVKFYEEILKHMEHVLNQTPDMLPVLKQAGVVDSGGQGLLDILKGGYDALLGKEVDYTLDNEIVSKSVKTAEGSSEDIKFGYCTEFIIMVENEYNDKVESDFKTYLSSIGDSVVVVSDDDIVKVHVHTNDPGLAIQKALSYGSLTSMKIDNMREEHEEKLIKEAEKQNTSETKQEKKDVGFIAVSIGDGLGKIFKGLGVNYLIEGGQTMNPSTEDILNAIECVNADTVYILPNNKNIILAAEQAQKIVTDKEIVVIPSKTIPQGITATINYVQGKSTTDNYNKMVEEMSKVKTGQVTYAVRDTSLDDKEIKQGDIMGIGDKSILSVGNDILSVTEELIEQLVDDNSELISIYYGSEISEEEANVLANEITELYPDCDIELHSGGQPIYYYILSVESDI